MAGDLKLGNVQTTVPISVSHLELGPNRGQQLPVIRKNCVTYKRARGSIRDAARQGLNWHGRNTILRGDGANQNVDGLKGWAADREPRDPTPCVGAQNCNARPTVLGLTVDAIQSGESTNLGTLGGWSR